MSKHRFFFLLGLAVIVLVGFFRISGTNDILAPTKAPIESTQPSDSLGAINLNSTSQKVQEATAKVEDKKPRPKVSNAINSIDAPARPTWEIVRDFKQDPKNTEKADLALAALSFCFNTKKNADKARAMQSQGLTSAPEYPAMKKIGEEHMEFCGRLLDSEYALRETIAKNRALEGDVDAMASYLSVSPLGEWPEPNQYTDPRVLAWKAAGIDFLEQAVRMKQRGALLSLAALYEPGNKVAKDEPLLFSDVQDPVKAYSYAYAWSNVVGATASEIEKKNVAAVLKSFESGLSKEQIESAKIKSRAIYSNFSKE
jgi:hypothetical protein